MRLSKCLLITASLAFTALAAAALFHVSGGQRDKLSSAISELTGAHTRVVWCRQIKGIGTSVFDAGSELQLTGLDTNDHRGERPIIRKAGHYDKPMITPRGDRIVFTDMLTTNICIVNWDGSALSVLTKGRATTLWADPTNGTEWVYAFPQEAIKENDSGNMLVRFKLDDPANKETVWLATPLTADGIRISSDGKRMGGLFPWPNACVADLTTGSIKQMGVGCWTSLSPDNNYLLWILDGAHRNVIIHSATNAKPWKVNINNAPGINGSQVFHPRWSNNTRFMCMNGPYRDGNNEQDRISAGGKSIEIYIGRFDDKMQSIEKWVQVTHDEFPDFFPDMWIASAPAKYRHNIK